MCHGVYLLPESVECVGATLYIPTTSVLLRPCFPNPVGVYSYDSEHEEMYCNNHRQLILVGLLSTFIVCIRYSTN